MNYEATWKIMEDLLAELRKSGETVPPSVMKDLRSAKTLMEVLRVDHSCTENLLRIEEYMNNVESYLVQVAKEKFGEKYVEEWTCRLMEAQSATPSAETVPKVGFPIGIPRDARWVRVKHGEASMESIKHLCREEGLKCRTEEDGNMLVYGKEARVKSFVRKMAKLSES